MARTMTATLLALVLVGTTSFSQDGPLRRAGRALDNAGKSIRNRVEYEIARGEVVNLERDVLGRVVQRIEWDKKLQGSALRVESRPDGTIVLRGSVTSEEAKTWAAELAANTIGVTSVVDEIAVAEEVKVIESAPGGTVIEVTPPAEPKKVIVKP